MTIAQKAISGKGNGPIDAFFSALHSVGLGDYEFVSYSEHAVSQARILRLFPTFSFVTMERSCLA